ncbi:Type I Iterative PKS [Pestalotiopsis sp. IQ-011]
MAGKDIAIRKNLMTEWPESRYKGQSLYDDSSKPYCKLYSKGTHFIGSDITTFDAPFFSVSPTEAAAMDPQQRLILETSYLAFENAGIPVQSLRGSKTSVFAASMADDYSRMFAKDPDNLPRFDVTGSASSILANRVSWFFDLVGSSVHVDTACSGSMVAFDLACQSLRDGDASMALVTGANLLLSPEPSVSLSNAGLLSKDSVCYSFDKRANGYGRGEGVVSMILKPVEAAIRDGNMIGAVVRATGSNHDENSPGIAHPSAESQESLIRHVYQKARLDFEETRYFEAHGTGTPVGDPIEMRAIGRVFRSARTVEEPLYVGSVKTNIGHLEACSGLAGLLKAVLVLERGTIPPNALFEELNPNINCGFYNTMPKCAKVFENSSSEYAKMKSMRSQKLTNGHAELDGSKPSEGHIPAKVLVWSANDEKALGRMVADYSQYYETHVVNNPEQLTRLASTLTTRRSNMLWRTFAVVTDEENATAWPLSIAKPVRAAADPGLAFVFTGQGAQFVNMGTDLSRYAVFLRTLQSVDEIYRELGSVSSILDMLQDAETINRPERSHAACTALQIALVELLKNLGVNPSIVVGHSSGEITAAPKNCTVAGSNASIDEMKQHLDDEHVFCSVLKTGIAYHSPIMKSITTEYKELINDIQPQKSFSHTQMISSVTGDYIDPQTLSTPQYWADNLASTVRFSEAMSMLGGSAMGIGAVTDIVEIGPYAALRHPIKDCLATFPPGKKLIKYSSVLDRSRSGLTTLLECLGGMHIGGHQVRLFEANLLPSAKQQSTFIIDGPKYPFDETQSYWAESRISRDYRLRESTGSDVLGMRAFDWNPLESRWRSFLCTEADPWTAQHVVAGSTIYPGAGMLVMAMEAAKQVCPPDREIRVFFFKEARFVAPIYVQASIEKRTEIMLRLCHIQGTYEKEST